MSDPKDVTRPRSPLTLSPRTPRPAIPRDEMARKLYGKTAPTSADHTKALALALRAGAPTPLSDDLTRHPGTDDLGILRYPAAGLAAAARDAEPGAGPGSAMFGLGAHGSRPLNEILATDFGGSAGLAAAAIGVHGQGSSRLTEILGVSADFGGPSEKYQRFTLKRDRDRPLAFDGRIVAEVEEKQYADQVVIRAAIYETQGGKFVTEMTRREVNPPANYGVGKRPFLFAKATVFESLDIAAMSFRTHGGRLTEELLRQIGDVDPEFIE
jgi:hypothetical protein